jgi:hypothetical protein
MSKLIENIPTEVTEAVAEALQLFQKASFRNQTDRHDASQPLPSLLQRCEHYISSDRQPFQEPVRLIHHFACTGGTLITKCLACSPNVQALSELDPLSSKIPESGHFNPTDLIQLLQHGNRGASMEDKLGLFMASFSALYDSATDKGLRLLVRDHTHSHFCMGETLPERPTLAEILARKFNTCSIITIRHPLDSWLSLANNQWIEFSPATLDEYASRYQAFLAAYPDARVFKYEEFVASPDDVLTEICAELGLPFPPDYKSLFMAHSFSGDSGRKGDVIEARERRPVADELMAAAKESASFHSLCEQLQYEF